MLRRVHPKKRSVSWVNSSVSRVTGDRLYVPTACAKRVHMFKRKIAFKLLMTGGAAVNLSFSILITRGRGREEPDNECVYESCLTAPDVKERKRR